MTQSSTHVLDRLQRIGVGLVFVLLPLFYWASLGKFLLKLYQMGNWVETPATIVEVDLVEGRYTSGRGGASSPYSQCQARYSYSFAGQPFEGTQVSLYNKPNFETSRFHQRICRDLLGYQESEQSFQIYVNPDDPFEAILYRDVFWGKAISPVFLVAAMLLGWGGLVLIRSAFVPQTEPKQQDDPYLIAICPTCSKPLRISTQTEREARARLMSSLNESFKHKVDMQQVPPIVRKLIPILNFFLTPKGSGRVFTYYTCRACGYRKFFATERRDHGSDIPL